MEYKLFLNKKGKICVPIGFLFPAESCDLRGGYCGAMSVPESCLPQRGPRTVVIGKEEPRTQNSLTFLYTGGRICHISVINFVRKPGERTLILEGERNEYFLRGGKDCHPEQFL